MKTTKSITGKNKKVTSTKDLRVGDVVRIVEGHTKKGQPKLSGLGYSICEIVDDQVLEITMHDDNDDEYTKRLLVKNIRLEFIVTLELHTINITFSCREAGKQTVEVSVHDFMSSEQDCELCGSHGDRTVDVNCACGKTHEIELSSW